MKAILTEGRVAEYIVVRSDDTSKPVPNVLLLFPYEDREVQMMLRQAGEIKLADKLAKYWEEQGEWEK